jgi:hypothetical protein
MRKKSKNFRTDYTTQTAYMVKFSVRSVSKNWLSRDPMGFQNRNFCVTIILEESSLGGDICVVILRSHVADKWFCPYIKKNGLWDGCRFTELHRNQRHKMGTGFPNKVYKKKIKIFLWVWVFWIKPYIFKQNGFYTLKRKNTVEVRRKGCVHVHDL